MVYSPFHAHMIRDESNTSSFLPCPMSPSLFEMAFMVAFFLLPPFIEYDESEKTSGGYDSSVQHHVMNREDPRRVLINAIK